MEAKKLLDCNTTEALYIERIYKESDYKRSFNNDASCFLRYCEMQHKVMLNLDDHINARRIYRVIIKLRDDIALS